VHRIYIYIYLSSFLLTQFVLYIRDNKVIVYIIIIIVWCLAKTNSVNVCCSRYRYYFHLTGREEGRILILLFLIKKLSSFRYRFSTIHYPLSTVNKNFLMRFIRVLIEHSQGNSSSSEWNFLKQNKSPCA